MLHDNPPFSLAYGDSEIRWEVLEAWAKAPLDAQLKGMLGQQWAVRPRWLTRPPFCPL